MKKKMKRLGAWILVLTMITAVPGMSVAAEEPQGKDTVVEQNGEETVTDHLLQEENQTEQSDDVPADGTASEDTTADEIASEDTITDEITSEDTTVDETTPDETVPTEEDDVVYTDEIETAPEPSGDYAVPGSNFDDVNASDWYVDYVGYVLNKGIMTGVGDNKFAPGNQICRAQFATVLYRIEGSPSVTYDAVFPDVPDNQFYSQAVVWANSQGIVTGYSDGKFGPNDYITREQMVTILYRYAKYKEFNVKTRTKLDKFPDASSVNEFAYDAMEWCVWAGIISGDKGKLNPQGYANRAETSAMIQRFCEKLMPGQLPDIELSASCKTQATIIDEKIGTFWVKITDVQASAGVNKVQIAVWCADDQSDFRAYNLQKQSDGSYGILISPAYHGYHFGNYKISSMVLMNNNVRLYAGSQNIQVNGSEAQSRVFTNVNNIYDAVGQDLNACYWWCVNNISYKTLPIPLNPPEGYTRAQWYSILGYEQRSGNCYVYAAAFYWLAIGLGYDAEFIEGEVGMASGGYGPHGWVLIHMNGSDYICDPEAQYEIGGYNFYMQPVSNPILQYRW